MKLHSIVVLATLACSAPTAWAANYPKLKPGLWEVTIHTNKPSAKAPVKSSMCLDESVQEEMMQVNQGMQQRMCSKNSLRNEGGKIVGDAECTLGTSKMKSHAVTTFSGDSAYRTETEASYDPPLMGMTQSSTTIEGRYVGPCKPGMRPGDIATGGRTVNVRDFAAHAQGPGKK